MDKASNSLFDGLRALSASVLGHSGKKLRILSLIELSTWLP
jgi:hypothetical protein